jgi:hypothetical protein
MAEKSSFERFDSFAATLTVQAPRIHIYPFSRIVGAPAGRWEKLIADLEAKEQIVYLYYQPVREAIVRFTADAGQHRDKTFAEMCRRAGEVIHAPTQNPVRDNSACFLSFEEHFFPQISEFKASLLRVPQAEGTLFSGIILKGLPHMLVVDSKGKDRYVYLYPSNWKDHELDAYMELLTIIIESEFSADSADLWCMGLKKGITIPRPKSKMRTRQACREAAKHFKRMADAGLLNANPRSSR